MTNETIQTFARVCDALEETPEDAANMRPRSELMTAVRGAIEGRQLSQVQAAKRLGITQPRLNDLMRGRIGKFSLDALIVLAERSGLSGEWRSPTRRRKSPMPWHASSRDQAGSPETPHTKTVDAPIRQTY
jgi:predicted XRE-type DNA-binding protein